MTESRGDMIPIRRGTAHRLGIRTPPVRQRLSPEQYEEMKAKWSAALREETKAIYASLPHGKPYLMPAIERAARPRRHWPWRRPSRSDTP